MRVIGIEDSLAMAVFGWNLLQHRFMHVPQIIEHARRRYRFDIAGGGTILLHRRGSAGETVTMKWLPAIRTPVAEKFSRRHVARMIVGDGTREFIEF